jgi:transcriptional regulator with PAS, ATPase and Fis domain
MEFKILQSLPFAVTVCNKDAEIIYMNDKSVLTFLKNSEDSIIGKSLFDCHNENSVLKIKELLNLGDTNTYTIEKNGVKKLIYQCPWYQNGEIAGLVEISIILPDKIPHFIR